MIISCSYFSFFFFFNDTATTEIYTLSLHDALPILVMRAAVEVGDARVHIQDGGDGVEEVDRKSTRLNSSHSQISYAVFCLKKKKKNKINESLRKTERYETSRVDKKLCE